ncbi:HNH endonuclease signature motif containing protein [Pectobacterium versatile]|uniref:HNH endonuclease signature motif containing protein n=1 Tax=Pectobacterium versatile TaxID=2488639 RepID=UPI000F8F48EA|nr:MULTISPECIES: HNH endonuclease signature motif containing protein [Pectobacterium]MCL6375499.1 HNH endonuclease [Pectobacterium atrosepticum]RUR87889.1 hypothetical protein PB16LOC_04289 [Pectobacterium versatile]
MRNLPLPDRESSQADMTTSVREYTYRKILRGHKLQDAEVRRLLAIYDRYDADRGAASDFLKGEELPRSLTDAVYAAYDRTQEGRLLYSLRERLFKGVDLCPVCGIDTVSELDHFLPRSEFKPLAIYSRNLVPNCHHCNHIKLAGFGEQNEGELALIHAYFDELPDEYFLEARIEISEGGLIATFQVMADVELPERLGERLAHQIETLELNERYEKEINTYLMSHATGVYLEHARDGKAGVRRFLRTQARIEEKKLYLNHWRPTLLRALSKHDEFTDGGFIDIFNVPQDILDDLFDDEN